MSISERPYRWTLLVTVAAASIAPPSAVAAQFGTLTSTINAPAEVAVGTAASVTVTVQQTAAASYVLNAGVSEGKTCTDPLSDDRQLIVDKAVSSGTASFSATLPNKLVAGRYTICVYLQSVDDPGTSFTDQASLTVRALEPRTARPWTIATDKFYATRLGPLDLKALRPARAQFLLGLPDNALLASGSGCSARSPQLGLTLTFLTMNQGPRCGDGAGLNFVDIGGKRAYARVRTASKLALGDPASRIRRVYRNAKRERGTRNRWLLRPQMMFNFESSAIIAIVRGNKVDAFHAYVGAGGE